MIFHIFYLISQSPATPHTVYAMAQVLVSPLPTAGATSLLPDLEAMLLKTGLGCLQHNCTTDPRMREGIVVRVYLFIVYVYKDDSTLPQPVHIAPPIPLFLWSCGPWPRFIYYLSLSPSLYRSIYLSGMMLASIHQKPNKIAITCHHFYRARLISFSCAICRLSFVLLEWAMHGYDA